MSIEWQIFLPTLFATWFLIGWIWCEDKLWRTNFLLADADARLDWYAQELRHANEALHFLSQENEALRAQIDAHDCGIASVTPLESAKRRHPSRLGPAS